MNKSQPKSFFDFFTAVKCLFTSELAVLGLFTDQNDRFSTPFTVLQLMKSLPFHVPEAWKGYPIRAESPHIGYYNYIRKYLRWFMINQRLVITRQKLGAHFNWSISHPPFAHLCTPSKSWRGKIRANWANQFSCVDKNAPCLFIHNNSKHDCFSAGMCLRKFAILKLKFQLHFVQWENFYKGL